MFSFRVDHKDTANAASLTDTISNLWATSSFKNIPPVSRFVNLDAGRRRGHLWSRPPRHGPFGGPLKENPTPVRTCCDLGPKVFRRSSPFQQHQILPAATSLRIFLLLCLLVSSSFPLPEPPFLCGPPSLPFPSEDGWLLYPLSNLHAEVTPCKPARGEKKGKVMWEEERGELPFNSTHLRSALKRGLLSLAFVSSSSISLKELSSSIKETSRKRKEVVYRRALRHLARSSRSPQV